MDEFLDDDWPGDHGGWTLALLAKQWEGFASKASKKANPMTATITMAPDDAPEPPIERERREAISVGQDRALAKAVIDSHEPDEVDAAFQEHLLTIEHPSAQKNTRLRSCTTYVAEILEPGYAKRNGKATPELVGVTR